MKIILKVIIFYFLIFQFTNLSLYGDSIYVKTEPSKLKKNEVLNKLEITLYNESNDSLLFVPDFIFDGFENQQFLIYMRAYVYSHNFFYFVSKKNYNLSNGISLKNYNIFPQMIVVNPKSKLIISFDTDELKKKISDTTDLYFYTLLRLSKKSTFDSLFFNKFNLSSCLPYSTEINITSISVKPNLNDKSTIETYNLNEPSIIMQILNYSFNIFPYYSIE